MATRRRALCGHCLRFISVSGIHSGVEHGVPIETGKLRDHMDTIGHCPGSGLRVELAGQA